MSQNMYMMLIAAIAGIVTAGIVYVLWTAGTGLAARVTRPARQDQPDSADHDQTEEERD